MQNIHLALAAGSLVVLAGCNASDVVRPDDVFAAPASSSAYTASQLPLPVFSTMGVALAVNDSGWIVGWTDSVGGADGGRAPTLWRPSQAPVRLPVRGTYAFGGYAADINNGGDIVGVMGGFGNPWGSGLAWDRRGRPVVTAAVAIIPSGVNVSGGVAADTCAGYCNAAVFARAFTGGTALACLGTPTTFGGCIYGHAASINDAGWVVGTYRPNTTGAVKHAVLWNPSGAVTELPLNGGNIDSAVATHINNRQTVSGHVSVSGAVQPIAWYATGAFAFVAPGYTGSATSVSDNNRVVGTLTLAKGSTQAFTAFSAATLTLLSPPRGARGGAAEDVNSCGMIVGSAVNSGSQKTVPVVWIPYPADACDAFQPPPVDVRVAKSYAAARTDPPTLARLVNR